MVEGISMTKVSVITATHNRPEMLKLAIDSVLSQTVRDFEYIIVDDRSTPETKEVIESFNDPRIKYIRNEENPKQTHCRPLNVGIKESTGDYICYLDDDNEFLPYHIEILQRTLDTNPDIDVAYCDMMVIGADGSTTQGISMDFDAQFLLHRNFIDTSEAMHRRDTVFAVGGWNERVTRFTDWNLWVRMTKWGAKFQRVPIVGLRYYAHGGDTQSKRTKVESYYDPALQLTMFIPSFDPTGDFIFENYLGDRPQETTPRIAIFTLSYDRLDYTKRMAESLYKSTKVKFDWFVYDQGSVDGSAEWLKDFAPHFLYLGDKNVGITKASNRLLDEIGQDYQIIIKIDNDCEFLTKYWLETLVDLWKRNHMLYMSPYPEGLVNNPGGAYRVGYGNVGPYFIEVTKHIGGLCAFADARAYDGFRWTDQFKHGNQDTEASMHFRERGFMPCYVPLHRVYHIDGTSGQQKKYKEYFERRVKEKTEVA